MNYRVTVVALVSALILGFLGAIFVPPPAVAACTDPPGGIVSVRVETFPWPNGTDRGLLESE